MEQKKDRIRHFVLPTKDGEIIGLPISQKEIEMVIRLYDENPDKYEAGAEGVLKALEELRRVELSDN